MCLDYFLICRNNDCVSQYQMRKYCSLYLRCLLQAMCKISLQTVSGTTSPQHLSNIRMEKAESTNFFNFQKLTIIPTSGCGWCVKAINWTRFKLLTQSLFSFLSFTFLVMSFFCGKTSSNLRMPLRSHCLKVLTIVPYVHFIDFRPQGHAEETEECSRRQIKETVWCSYST